MFQITDMADWEITNTVDGAVIDAGRTIAVKAKNNIADPKKAMYWVAPNAFIGNKVWHSEFNIVLQVQLHTD